MSLGRQLAALAWQTCDNRHVARRKEVIWRNLIRSWHDRSNFVVIFPQRARNFFIILFLHKVDNISFEMSLSSQLAALVWQTDVHRNIARSKEVIWRILMANSEADMTRLSLMLDFYNTARNFFILDSRHTVKNISFQMSLDSHLAALVC